jgi:hypothetical protein
MAGYIGKSQGVTQVDGYTASEADSEFVSSSGDSMTGDLSFGDNDKAIFGAGSDLQIHHDGSDSYITDSGTGNLRIGATNLKITNGADTEVYIDAFENGAVNLRYDNSQKLATTSTGINVTGDIAVSGGVYLGGTGSANYLDDYEEGTWTPTITFGSGGSATAASVSCQYTKIGRLVHISGRFTLTSFSGFASGELIIGSLPFTVYDITGDNNSAGIQVFFENPSSDIGADIVGLPIQSSTNFYIRISGTTGSQLLGGFVQSTTVFLFGGSYAAA